MNSLGVIRRCIKSHLYPVASFGICNLYLCFYNFTSIVISQLYMYVCYVINEISINQSI